MQRALHETLTAALAPVHLVLENESHKHSVPAGSESHFKLLIVSAAFEGKAPVARHRMVNEAVATLGAGGGALPVHALSVTAKTPAQWGGLGEAMHETPNCKGGAGR